MHRPTDRPTDQLCPSHSRDTDTLHVPTLLRAAAMPRSYLLRAAAMPRSYHVNSAVSSRDSYKTENADDGEAKSRDTRATNCKAGTRERPGNLFILALPCLSRHASLGFTCQFYSSVTSHKPFFTLSYISTACVHCIMDKTSRTRNAYGRP